MSSEIRVNLEPTDVNRVVAEAIINSQIGTILKEQIQKQLQTLSASWNNPIEHVIKDQLNRMVVEILQEQRETIRVAVLAAMTDEKINSIVTEIVAKLLKGRYE